MNICTITISGLVNRVEAKNIGGTVLVKLGVKVRTGFGEKTQNTYFNVNMWGRKGSSDLTPAQEAAIKQLKDGSPVVISGKLEPREYEGKNDSTMQSADSSEVPF